MDAKHFRTNLSFVCIIFRILDKLQANQFIIGKL